MTKEESYHSMQSRSRLSSCEKEWMFHGSPDGGIDVLEPREAKDIRKGESFNNDTAVFGTQNLCESIIYGVVNLGIIPEKLKKGKSWGCSNYDGDIIARIPMEWQKYIEENIGYVYVLPKRDFTEFEGEHGKSKITVRREDKVPIMVSDFIHFGGKIEWK